MIIVSEENPVRVIDSFVDELDLAAQGFDSVVLEATGHLSYHSAGDSGDPASEAGTTYFSLPETV
jgi:hypothetical protein